MGTLPLRFKEEKNKNNYKKLHIYRVCLMSIHRKLILERKKELKMKVIKKIFWKSKTNFKFFQFEESVYNFNRKIKLINKLNMYDFVDSHLIIN